MIDRRNLIMLIIAIVAILAAWQYKNIETKKKNLEIAKQREIKEKEIAAKNLLFMELSKSIKNKDTKSVMNLLNKEIDINRHYKNGNTPLHLAAVNKSYEITYLLLKQGAEIDTTNDFEQTPLHLATIASADDVVFLLIREGANYKLVDKNSDRALDLALKRYDQPLLKVLKFLEY